MESGGVIYLVGIAFLVVLGLLWFFLPFAVFGTQPKLDSLLVEVRRTNQLLTEINNQLAKSPPGAAPAAGPTKPIFKE